MASLGSSENPQWLGARTFLPRRGPSREPPVRGSGLRAASFRRQRELMLWGWNFLGKVQICSKELFQFLGLLL